MKVVRQNDISIEVWHRFIEACPSASIYHLPEWSRVLELTFGYQSFNLFALDDNNQLCGVLPLSLVKSPLTGSHLASLPFSHVVGPLFLSDDALQALIEKAKNLLSALKCDYIEIRLAAQDTSYQTVTPWLQQGFEVSTLFSTFVLELSEPEKVWTKLDSKSVRWAVRKAQKDGVTIRESASEDDIKQFYELNLRTKRRLGVPGHPLKLFKEIFKELGAHPKLYLAGYQNRLIAGIITGSFKDSVLYWYGASEMSYRKHQPNDLLVWTAIENSCREGYKWFDFGRVSSAEHGLSSFKKHWGTNEMQLLYCFFPHTPESLALNPRGMKYRIASSTWKRIPLPLTRLGSDILFKYLG